MTCGKLVLALVAAAALAAGGAGSAAAYVEGLPDPDRGAAPDVRPVFGQPAVPEIPALRNCVPSGYPRADNGRDPRGLDPRSPNPLAGLRFFVDPTEPAFQEYADAWREGDAKRARLLARIAFVPRARWMGRFTRPNMKKKIRDFLECVAAIQPGSVPIIVVMRHQGKKCSPTYDGGGPAEDARTKKWWDDFVDVVGNARVVIGFEPDSIGTVECLKPSRRMARLNLLRYGMWKLSQLPNATIYLEAEASDWQDPELVAEKLKLAGIQYARGFMLNVTHYDWPINNIRYGWEISRLVGNKPFIINTGSVGRGPHQYYRRVGGRRKRFVTWCNPPGRGLGVPTTADTHFARVDGFLWLDRPGLSDGTCNGGPPVGEWWDERALSLARNATDWLYYPRRF
ncbi:glycoside hydrolase family 6 protein [Thermoleophilum album]|uniref:glycoside hydrolase family 6 protein n=1 Tax=Thermoleophilum album TaxID=29539 RepID=UPI00237C8EB9|nr:glycoside hydrolase family 6 protein [Thermoleophilum album]WDT93177.1 glycoside hydrolase family 6 protein [Thermoleophilum album]